MLIGVVAEKDPQEKRVAASPETVKKFIALGAEAVVESGARESPPESPTPTSPRPARGSAPPPKRSPPTSF